MTSIYVKTLGCKVNTFDSQALEAQFERSGYRLSTDFAEADVALINTCSVTEAAEKEARYWLRRFYRAKPDAVRVVTGCYAQINSERIAELKEVDFIVPNEVKENLVPLVAERLRAIGDSETFTSKLPPGVKSVKDNKQAHFKSALTLFDQPSSTQTRSFIKIQDGCDGFCAYCQIPYARGTSRSVAPELALKEAQALVEKGIKELVFTGIHLGHYGDDLGIDAGIEHLLTEVFAIPGLGRVRLSSLEPSEATPRLFALLAAHRDQVCDHFHLPLQSGNDRVLKVMRREYDTAEYRASTDMIRSFFPGAHLSADVIVGFPQETEEEFQDSMNFVRACNLASLHVFPYSKRPNTTAARMPGHVDGAVIKDRVHRLKEASRDHYRTYARQFFGTTQSILWEASFDKSGRQRGKTRNYLSVVGPAGFSVPQGTILPGVLHGFIDGESILAI